MRSIRLPFGKNQRFLASGIGAAIAGGWQVNGRPSFYSRAPFWIRAPTSLRHNGPQLADQVNPHVQIYGAPGLLPYFGALSAFAPVTLARFGTSNFDSFRGPGYRNVDFGLFRTFGTQERLKAQIRMEASMLQIIQISRQSVGGVTDPNAVDFNDQSR